MVKLLLETDILPTRALTCTIYGEPGTFKTSLAFTAEQTMLFDFDSGVERAVGRSKVVKMDSWLGFTDFIDGKTEYGNALQVYGIKTIAIDTAESMIKYMAEHVMRINPNARQADGTLTLKGFGAVKYLFEQLLQKLRMLDIDLVMLCHATTEKNGDSIRYVPKITGGSYDILLASSDLVGYTYVKGAKNVLLDFRPTSSHFGKNAPNFPEFTLPHYSRPEWKDYLAQIITKTKEAFMRMSDEQAEAYNTLRHYEQLLHKAADLEELSDYYQELSSQPKMIHLQLEGLFKKRMHEMLVEAINASEKLSFIENYLLEGRNFGVEVGAHEIEQALLKVFNSNHNSEHATPEDFNKLVTWLAGKHTGMQKVVKNQMLASSKARGWNFDPESKQFYKPEKAAKPRKETQKA